MHLFQAKRPTMKKDPSLKKALNRLAIKYSDPKNARYFRRLRVSLLDSAFSPNGMDGCLYKRCKDCRLSEFCQDLLHIRVTYAFPYSFYEDPQHMSDLLKEYVDLVDSILAKTPPLR